MDKVKWTDGAPNTLHPIKSIDFNFNKQKTPMLDESTTFQKCNNNMCTQ